MNATITLANLKSAAPEDQDAILALLSKNARDIIEISGRTSDDQFKWYVAARFTSNLQLQFLLSTVRLCKTDRPNVQTKKTCIRRLEELVRQ